MTDHEGQSQRQTTERIRAVQPWEAITDIQANPSNVRGKYGTLARGLPAMIQINGLAVTTAFLEAKQSKNDEHKRMLVHLGQRLNFVLGSNYDCLMTFIRSASTEQYRRATAELITYATWLKRYSEAKGWKSSEGE
jgi:CRISPR type III-B/RAMP module-associated protein Cmr5